MIASPSQTRVSPSRPPYATGRVVRWLAATVVCLAAWPATPVAAQPAAATETKTVIVAAFASHDELMGDLDYLGELAGRPGMSGMIAFMSGGALQALDPDRPIGVVLQTDGVQFTPMVCLPVDDVNSVLEVAERFGIEPIGLGDDVYELDVQEQQVYVTQSGQWTYIAQSADSLETAPEDPSDQFAKALAEHDINVRVMAQNVPEAYRQMAVAQMQQGMQEGLVQEPGESDEDFAFRERLAEAQIEQLQDVINGLEELSIGLAIDRDEKNTRLDVAMTGLEGSDVALACSTYKESRSDFAGFHRPDAAVTMLATGTTPPELLEKQREQLEATVTMLRKQAKRGIEQSDDIPSDKRDALQEVVSDLLDVYEEMVLAGRADLGMSINLAGEGYDLLAGAGVEDPKKLEEAFKKLAAMGEGEPDFPGIEWNADSHNGVAFHHMAIPVPEEAGQLRELVGDVIDTTMGVGDGAVYLSIGTESGAKLKQAIDASAGRASETIKPVEMSISLLQVLEAVLPVAEAQGEGGAVVGMIVDTLREQPEGSDHLRVTTEGNASGRGFVTRFVIEEGVLRSAGAAASAAAQAAGQAGGGY